MWVYIWAAQGGQLQDDRYEWYNGKMSDEALKDEAREFASNSHCIVQESERGYRYGFKRLRKLPEHVRGRLVASSLRAIKNHRKYVKFLREQECSKSRGKPKVDL